MTGMMEMAKDLGKALARTDEYQILKRAVAGADDDREMAEFRAEIENLEGQLEASLRSGKEPEDSLKTSYEDVVARLERSPTYQRLISAQSNFDKVLLKVNQTIQAGIAEGAESRIIIP